MPPTTPEQDRLRVAAAQVRAVWLDAAATTRGVCDRIAEAAAAGVDLLAFPEAHLPGYPSGWR